MSRSPTVPPPTPTGLTRSLERNIDALARRRRADEAAASGEERVASAITAFIGSMPFVYLHLAVYGVWTLANAGALAWLPRWDPNFTMLATEASVEAIFLSTFVLIRQNSASRAADKRADLDLHITLLTEHELTKLTQLVSAIAAKLDIAVDADQDLTEVTRDVAPEAVLDELDHTSRRR